MTLDLNEFRHTVLKGGDVVVTYGVWILARYRKAERKIVLVTQDAPPEMHNHAIKVLKDEFPEWEVCTWL